MSFDQTVAGRPKQHNRRIAMQFIAVILLAIMAFTQSTSGWSESVRIAGLFFILLGIAGRIWCTAHIGGRKFSRLVTSGPFSVCRNPLYVFSLLAVFGAGLQSGSVVFATLAALCFLVVIDGSVVREEAALMQRFAGAYADYCKTAPRYWPRLSSWRRGEAEPAPRRLLLRTALEGSVFLLIIPAQWLMSQLQDQGILPVLLKLAL